MGNFDLPIYLSKSHGWEFVQSNNSLLGESLLLFASAIFCHMVMDSKVFHHMGNLAWLCSISQYHMDLTKCESF